MQRKVTVMPLKGIVPEGTRKAKRYVFAISQKDYTNWTLANLKLGATEEFIYVQHLDDVRNLRHIVYSITAEVEKSPGYHKAINEVLAIVNFNYADKIDEQILPKVLQEMMNETPFLNKLFGRIWQVGDVIRSKRAYPPIEVEAGITIGVIVHIADKNPQVLFENGEDSGWSEEDAREDFEFIRHCDQPHIAEYKFTSVIELCRDYDSGYFLDAFNDEDSLDGVSNQLN